MAVEVRGGACVRDAKLWEHLFNINTWVLKVLLVCGVYDERSEGQGVRSGG